MSFTTWWNEKKTYPSGAQFSRKESFWFTVASLVALASLVPVLVFGPTWLLNSAIQGWTADLHSTPAQVAARNLPFLAGLDVVLVGVVALRRIGGICATLSERVKTFLGKKQGLSGS